MGKLTLILGGARSGKSEIAERLAVSTGKNLIYLASAQAFDDEMRRRITVHKDRRNSNWDTIEEPLDVAAVLLDLPDRSTVLFDCATLWLSNHLLADHDLASATADLLDALGKCRSEVIVVSNEVGFSGVPENALARRFQDAQGRLNQHLAASSECVIGVMAGLPFALKGVLPEGLA